MSGDEVILQKLKSVLEFERESHTLLDDSFMNLAHSKLSDKDHQFYIQQIRKATDKHKAAVDLMESVIRYLDEL